MNRLNKTKSEGVEHGLFERRTIEYVKEMKIFRNESAARGKLSCKNYQIKNSEALSISRINYEKNQ